jgi:putative membrane protein
MMGLFMFGGGMIIVWLIIVGLVVWGIVALARRAGSRTESSTRRSPLDIAGERYARGEITRDEFERIKKDLT